MNTLTGRIKAAVRRFRHDQDGLAAAEMVVVLPIYLFCILGTYTYWDAYDVVNRTQKAAYTVSDLVTRKQDEVTEDYVEGMYSTMEYLLGDSLPVKTRITSIYYDGSVDNRYEVIWSRSSYPGIPRLTTGTINEIISHLPEIADGDALVVVEATVDFTPIIGSTWTAHLQLFEGQMKHVVVTRPRFLPKVCMEDLNCNT